MHIADVVNRGEASAVAIGSMVVFQAAGMGVLVNFPDPAELDLVLRN
jgi:cyclase